VPETHDDAALVRHDEELRIGSETFETGRLRARKRVETERVEERVGIGHEDAAMERQAVDGEDSGEIETLPDGSISIPLFAEELVVEKRLVVRERVIVRKTTELSDHLVVADLRRERLELDADEGVDVRDDGASRA
jgi:uncharacterized protein (TIGR02271 family)